MTENKKNQADAMDLMSGKETIIDNPEVIEEPDNNGPATSAVGLLQTAIVALLVSFVVVATAYFLREPLNWSNDHNQAQSISALSENLQGRLASLEKEIQANNNSQKVTALNQQLKTLKSNIAGLKKDVDSSSGVVGTEEIAALRQQLVSLQSEGNEENMALRQQLMSLQSGGNEENADLRQQLANVESKRKEENVELRQQLSDLESVLNESKNQVKKLMERIDSLTSENEAVKTALSKVSSSLASVEQKQSQPPKVDNTSKASALLVTATQIKLLAKTGKGFAAELEALQKMAVDDSAVKETIDELQPFAKSGVTTLPLLKAGVPQLIQDIKQVEATQNQASLLDAVLGQVSSVVTVRRTDGAESLQSVDGVLARTSLALDESNLTQAIKELQSLDEAFDPVTSDWLAKAIDSEKVFSLASALQTASLKALGE